MYFLNIIRVSFRRNFLELNVYMRDLRVQEYKQLEAYTIIDLLSKAYLCYCITETDLSYVTDLNIALLDLSTMSHR